MAVLNGTAYKAFHTDPRSFFGDSIRSFLALSMNGVDPLTIAFGLSTVAMYYFYGTAFTGGDDVKIWSSPAISVMFCFFSLLGHMLRHKLDLPEGPALPPTTSPTLAWWQCTLLRPWRATLWTFSVRACG